MEDQHTIEVHLTGLQDHSLVAVYDGHGGQFAAKFAGKTLVAEFLSSESVAEYNRSGFRETSLLEKALKETFVAVDEKLKTEADVQCGDCSGCTAICAVITPSHIVCASAGDSRGIMVTSGQVRALSEDHKPDGAIERERIESAGGCVSMRRVDGDLAVARALGDFQYKDRPDLPVDRQKVTCVPDVRTTPRSSGDEVLVLACDGIWDVMSNQDCCDCVRQIYQEGETDSGLVCEELLDTCLTKGSRDNMSVVMVQFPAMLEPPPGTAAGAERGGGVMARRSKRAEEQRAREAAQDNQN